MHVLLLVKFFSCSTFLDSGHNIYRNDFHLSMQLQTTSAEATIALGGTAVEFEQSLNFYAGWCKNILPCSNKARYKQGVLYITSILCILNFIGHNFLKNSFTCQCNNFKWHDGFWMDGCWAWKVLELLCWLAQIFDHTNILYIREAIF